MAAAADASDQAELGQGVQVVLGRGLGKATEHDMADAAIRGTKLGSHRADRDPRGSVRRKGIDAGRYGREGYGREAVHRCQIERNAITGREQVIFSRLCATPDRADSVDDVLGGQTVAACDLCRTGFTAAERLALGE